MKYGCNIKESVRQRFPFFFLMTMCVVMIGCEQPEQNRRVVARVNDQELTMEMIYAQIDTSTKPSNAELRQFINRWITNELLFQEAQRKGYDASDDIQKKVEEARKQLSISELLEQEVYELAERSITPDEIAVYYQSHADEYTLTEDLVQISVAVFNQNDAAVEFRAAALGSSGWNQAALVFRSDMTKGMISYSDSLFFTQSTLYPSELWKVTTILGRDEVSFPIKTSAGFFVIQLHNQLKKGSAPPVTYIESGIRQRLTMERRQQRYQEFIQQLRSRHTVQLMFAHSDSSAFGGE